MLNTVNSHYNVQKCALLQNKYAVEIWITDLQQHAQLRSHSLPVAASCGASSVGSWIQQLPRIIL